MDSNLVVKMRTGSAAGGSNQADDIALANFLAFHDIHSRKVCVPRLVAVAMIDNYAASVAAVPVRVDYDPVRRNLNRRSGGRGNVDTGMHGAFTGERIAAATVAAFQTAVDRPGCRQ